MDNYFTSLLLFWAIREQHGLEAVGTINKNRMFLSPLFLATKIDQHHRLYLVSEILVQW